MSDNQPKPLTDRELRARTERLLAEAVLVAKQLRIQTERLASAIDMFQADLLRDGGDHAGT